MKEHLPAGRLLHVERMKMRWGDMDALGHLNNTLYFRYLEQARLSWFESLGYDYSKDTEGAMLGTVSCRFIIPVLYPAEVDITLHASHAGRSSFRLASTIVDATDPGRLYAVGDAAMVWIDLKSGRSTALPDRIRELCQP